MNVEVIRKKEIAYNNAVRHSRSAVVLVNYNLSMHEEIYSIEFIALCLMYAISEQKGLYMNTAVDYANFCIQISKKQKRFTINQRGVSICDGLFLPMHLMSASVLKKLLLYVKDNELSTPFSETNNVADVACMLPLDVGNTHNYIGIIPATTAMLQVLKSVYKNKIEFASVVFDVILQEVIRSCKVDKVLLFEECIKNGYIPV